MPRLQQIKRKNGSDVHSVNIPLEIIEDLQWKKGQELDVEEDHGKIIISESEEVTKEEEASNKKDG